MFTTSLGQLIAKKKKKLVTQTVTRREKEHENVVRPSITETRSSQGWKPLETEDRDPGQATTDIQAKKTPPQPRTYPSSGTSRETTATWTTHSMWETQRSSVTEECMTMHTEARYWMDPDPYPRAG